MDVIKEEYECKEEIDVEEFKFHPSDNMTPPTKSKKEKQVKCSYCNKCITYMSSYKRKRHYATHKFDKKSLECDHCSRKFSIAANLEVHMRAHLGTTFKCKICRKEFTRNENLSKHMRIHNKEFFDCDICKKKFVWKNSVRLHMPTHFNIVSAIKKNVTFACVFCKKVYGRERDLLLHAVVHFKKHPYQCKTCCKTYFRKSSLTRHLRNHSKEKLHSCKKCNKGFTRKYHFESHSCSFVKFHCDFCSRYVSSKKAIENHIMNYHLNVRNAYYYCTKCYKMFHLLCHAKKHKACFHPGANVNLMFLTVEERKMAMKYSLAAFKDVKLIKIPSVPLLNCSDKINCS